MSAPLNPHPTLSFPIIGRKRSNAMISGKAENTMEKDAATKESLEIAMPRIIRRRSNAIINGTAEHTIEQHAATKTSPEIVRLSSRFNAVYPRPLRYNRPLRKARMRLMSSRLPTIYDDEVLQI